MVTCGVKPARTGRQQARNKKTRVLIMGTALARTLLWSHPIVVGSWIPRSQILRATKLKTFLSAMPPTRNKIEQARELALDSPDSGRVVDTSGPIPRATKLTTYLLRITCLAGIDRG